MTAPIDEEEVVVSLRLQPVVARPDGWRGRSSSLVAVGLVGFIVIGIALGAAFDGGVPAGSAAVVVPPPGSGTSSPEATRRPNPTRRPQLPPLPAIEILGGQIPTEHRLVYANGYQVLDLATGELTTPSRPYEDLLVPIDAGGFVCACVVRHPQVDDTAATTVDLQFERLDTSGGVVIERDVLSFDGIVAIPEMTEGFTMVAALSPDQRSLIVLSAARRPPTWTVELHQIDIASGELLGSTVVDSLPVDQNEEPAPAPSARPAGTPPDGLYVWASAVAMSPDDAYIAASISYSEVHAENWTNGHREWLIPLSDGRPGDANPLLAEAQLDPDGWCLGPPTFLDAELFVQVCTSPDERGTGPAFHVRRVTTAGASVGDLPLPWNEAEGYSPITTTLDRGRRAIFAWNPVLHSVARIAIDDGSTVVSDVAGAMLPDDFQSTGRGYFGAEPGLVLSSDGRKLYALGFGRGTSDAGMPTGIWVFDAENLNLVDHWLPRAMLNSLAVSADGRFVYAAGAAGFDVEGHESPWPASVTVYGAETGEIQVVYGAVARDTWLAFRSAP